MKYFILFGPPGAGKGTQAAFLVEKFNLCHISTGELLRSEIASGSELGSQVDVIISQGNLVPDSMVEKMLAERIRRTGGEVNGLLLDGFPRTLSQAEDLDRLLASNGSRVDGVICLTIPDGTIAQRLAKRAKIEGRADDAQEATILNRIRTYHEQTEPLVQHYRKAGCFHEIDGDRSIEEVAASIEELMMTIA